MATGIDNKIILSIKGLTKSYGELVAVKDLSLDIYHGEIFGFLGPNGAGKTTTINMLCGLLKSDAGDIVFKGRSFKNNYLEYKQSMGLCPQDLIIWESLTCMEQLEIMGRLYKQNALPESLQNLAYQEGTLRLVSTSAFNLLPGLLEELQHQHLSIEDITVRKKTLEDVFIALTGRRLRE